MAVKLAFIHIDIAVILRGKRDSRESRGLNKWYSVEKAVERKSVKES